MNIHLTGIGGVGMAGLAVLLKNRGHLVDGCDLRPTPRTRWLEARGIPVAIGHDPKHVEGKDLVVVTPAVARDNPEYLAATGDSRYSSGSRNSSQSSDSSQFRNSREPICLSRGEVLAKLVNEASDSIAVCGSHGKTTTATFIAKLLIALGENVEWAIGGETGEFPVAGKRMKQPPTINHQPVLVVEADESDGTLALYRAKTLVVTNCEYDHPDHFKTPADYFACYEQAKAQAGAVVEGAGLGAATDDFAAVNARTAVEVARRRGHSAEAIAAVLPQVVSELPDRRFERLDEGVYTDYGHHPTEVRCSIARARELLNGAHDPSAPGKAVLRVLFQPHRYSRTKALIDDFAASFDLADEVVLCPTYAAFEPPLEGGDVCDLYRVMRERQLRDGKQAPRLFLARSCEEAWEHARNSMKPGDLTLVQGAGDILEKVKRKGVKGKSEIRRIWIGAGTNTVKSDLNLSVEYVKSDSPAGRIGMELLSPNSSLFSLHSSLFPWMAGIPGTLGGWVKMNAGAHGHSISEAIEAVKVDGRWIPAADCGFSYRHSDIRGEIQDVRFAEVKSEKGKVKSTEVLLSPDAYLSKRRKFPAHTRGSVFRNPEGDFAGRLLEEAGCKGLRVGGAYVWEGHANVIVAPPSEATASDFLALAELMRNRVYFRFGIRLEPEVRFGGEE